MEGLTNQLSTGVIDRTGQCGSARRIRASESFGLVHRRSAKVEQAEADSSSGTRRSPNVIRPRPATNADHTRQPICYSSGSPSPIFTTLTVILIPTMKVSPCESGTEGAIGQNTSSANYEFFPIGTRFYNWNSIPVATVSGPKGRRFLNFAVEPPQEILSIAGFHCAREVSREDFEVLRAADRKLFSAA